MRGTAERASFLLCLTTGRLLRAARYARVWTVAQDGERLVRKRRLTLAPPLIWLGNALLGLLDVGLRVLPQREWEARERLLYRNLRGSSIRVDAGRTLVMPFLTGSTLAELLEDAALQESGRRRAIELAAAALAAFHARGVTHGDAMAENVMIDLDADVAHWFDFETEHDARRSTAWRRADDLRALLATCLVRTAPETLAETVRLILDAYADEGVTRVLTATFTAPPRRPLVFHLAQAPLSYRRFREIATALSRRGVG